MLLTCATIAQSFMLVVTMAAGRHQQQHANHPELQLWQARRPDRVRGGAKARLCAVRRLYGPDDAGRLDVRRRFRAPVHHGRRHGGPGGVGHSRVQLALLPLGIQYEIVDGFTALGQVRYSLPLSFWRKLVYFVALFALPAAFGARAAFFAEPVSDVLGPAVSIAVYLLAIRRILQRPGGAARRA